MTSFTHLGLNHRTRPLPQEKAEQFARCLAANPRFAHVQTVASRSAGKFFVAYQPASETRYAELLQTESGKRQAKAETEGRDYIFVLDETRRFYWCQSTSGEVYQVCHQTCDCQDWIHRCRKAEIPCKHQRALRAGLGRYYAF